jgi:hypothetical protein
MIHGGTSPARNTAVAGTSRGFFVVWEDGSGTNGLDIHGVLVSGTGTLMGAELTVNATQGGDHTEPAVAAAQAGFYVVVWADGSNQGPDTDGTSIRARRFEGDGTPNPMEIAVNTTYPNVQDTPGLAFGAGNSFFVVWTDRSAASVDLDGAAVRGRRFGADGSSMDPSDFVLNTITAKDQKSPSIASSHLGYLVVWEDLSGQPGTSAKVVRGRFFANEYVPNGQGSH